MTRLALLNVRRRLLADVQELERAFGLKPDLAGLALQSAPTGTAAAIPIQHAVTEPAMDYFRKHPVGIVLVDYPLQADRLPKGVYAVYCDESFTTASFKDADGRTVFDGDLSITILPSSPQSATPHSSTQTDSFELCFYFWVPLPGGGISYIRVCAKLTIEVGTQIP